MGVTGRALRCRSLCARNCKEIGSKRLLNIGNIGALAGAHLSGGQQIADSNSAGPTRMPALRRWTVLITLFVSSGAEREIDAEPGGTDVLVRR